MSIEKFTISRDDSVYECFPHLCQTRSGRILLVYRESNGHVASEFCRLIIRYSDDAGQSWSDRRVVCEPKVPPEPNDRACHGAVVSRHPPRRHTEPD